jgi:hypothetical protein
MLLAKLVPVLYPWHNSGLGAQGVADMTYSTREIIKSFCILMVLCGDMVVLGTVRIDRMLPNFVGFWLQMGLIGLLLGVGTIYFTRYRLFIQGAHGEFDISDEFQNLPNSYKVKSNVVLGQKGDIDFLVIGPTGIWTVEVKSHTGHISSDGQKLLINGFRFRKDFLKQAWAQAFAVRDRIQEHLGFQMAVQPVVVFSNPRAYMRFGTRPVGGVQVVGRAWLLKLLKEGNGHYLSPETIDKLKTAFV